MFFQEITSITEFPGSNCLLPTIQTGSNWDFQVANLLPATVNFEPWTPGQTSDIRDQGRARTFEENRAFLEIFQVSPQKKNSTEL